MTGASGLEFPLIQAIDADLRISSDSVNLPALTIGRSAATVSLRGGKMLADIAELEVDDGTRGGGQIRIDMSGANPSYGVQAKFEAADIGRSVQAVFGHPTVQGRGLVTVDLTATGNTGESLLRSLDGKMSVSLAEGGRVGLDINELAATGNERGGDTWQEVSTHAIAIDKLDARFIVDDGVLRTQSAEALSGDRALKAEGSISLLEHRLDMELAVGDVTLETIDSADLPAKVGALNLKKREIINVHGPWSAPAISAGAVHDDPRQFGPR